MINRLPETNAERLQRKLFERSMYPPIVLKETCDLCGLKLEWFKVVPGEIIGTRHAVCIDQERARTKHLCPRPYQLPRRSRVSTL